MLDVVGRQRVIGFVGNDFGEPIRVLALWYANHTTDDAVRLGRTNAGIDATQLRIERGVVKRVEWSRTVLQKERSDGCGKVAQQCYHPLRGKTKALPLGAGKLYYTVLEYPPISVRTRSAAVDINALEVRLDDLIKNCDELREENFALKNQQDNLIAERASLIEKSELARSRVESMIARLKAMELGT